MDSAVKDPQIHLLRSIHERAEFAGIFRVVAGMAGSQLDIGHTADPTGPAG